MGSGVARALFTKWKQVKEEYHKFNEDTKPENLLSKTHFIDCGNKEVINIYGQFDYGYDRKRYVNYAIIAESLSWINCILSDKPEEDRMLALPKIGCGLAGGDWEVMKEIIDDATPDIEVWIYEL